LLLLSRSEIILFHAYLKNAVAYVPTVVKLQTGADVDPVAVVSVANTAGLRGALLDAIGRKKRYRSSSAEGQLAASDLAEIC
jgi:hypothetical protein